MEDQAVKAARIRLVCTDRGQHPSRDLALIDWMPATDDGVAVWDPETPLGEMTPTGLATSGRMANSGSWRTTERPDSFWSTTRKAGGVTFHLRCASCGPASQTRMLRDDTLRLMLEQDTPVERFDVSLIP